MAYQNIYHDPLEFAFAAWDLQTGSTARGTPQGGEGSSIGASSSYARPIDLAHLVAQPSEMPGFENATRDITSGTTAVQYVHEVLGNGPRAARKALSGLKREGFQEGANEFFEGLRGEAISVVVVYRSRTYAKRALRERRAEDIDPRAYPRAVPFVPDGIPGAFGESEPDKEGPGGSANVGFVTGRCYFLVGNALRDSAEAAQLDAAPLAGATALYRREKRRCA